MRLKAMVGTVLAFAAMSGAAGAATAEVSVVTGRTSGDGFTVDSQSFIARYYLNGLQEADARSTCSRSSRGRTRSRSNSTVSMAS